MEEKVNILLVDDHDENLISLQAVLSNLNQNFVMARSGKEALKHLLDKDFAVILLDVCMPEMDGFETARFIRERERSRNTPIIFLTAIGIDEMHQFHGYSVGAVDYILKPFIPEILKAKVAIFVDLFHSAQKIKQQAQEIHIANEKLKEEIIERKKAHQEIQRLNVDLEKQNLTLQNLNRELEAFSRSVSHDLRAPLRNIQGFSNALLEDYADKLDEEGKDYLNRIIARSQQMDQLIQDLLMLSRITCSEISFVPVDMSSLARSIISNLHQTTPQRNVEFVHSPGLVVQGDERLLRIALENLLGNAWKFTSHREKASIEFGSMEKDGRQVYFVRDDGVGFDMSHGHKLFAPFQRLHSPEEFEGTGIGLTIAQRIVYKHGGWIWAEAAVNKGATFYFVI